jgi:transcriptional regulator with PAS, ATPase and Fis domain
MIRTRYHISFYIIIPFIIVGLTLLAAIIAFRLSQYCFQHQLDPGLPVFLGSAMFAGLALCCAVIIVNFLLKPMNDFISKTKTIPALSIERTQMAPHRHHQIDEISQVFDNVAKLLSQVDARHFFPDIIGESRAIRSVLSQIMQVAPTDSTVLILGESGTGKELIATSIYEHSNRKDKPFIKLNCVAVAEGLWESELFGHEKGAFTGATQQKPGKFEQAHGGTLFLDEIGDMPRETQAKILRVLQEKEFERVGGTRTLKVDVRFIAATNKNLEQMVADGTFREDLFYRLNVFSLTLPPLRERPEDVALLARHFLGRGPNPAKLSNMALHLLKNYAWPGNVRQLQNTIERAGVVAEDGLIDTAHLPKELTNGFSRRMTDRIKPSLSLDDQLKEIEKGFIVEALKKAGGVQVKAAEMLGINQRSLWHRIKKYEIDARQMKNGA